MQNVELISFANANALARAAASAWLDEIKEANRVGKGHYVTLSGGRTAQKFFATTVEQAKARAVSFEHVHFFWSDERCVPPTDPESNFRLANELLFLPLNISAEQIHRLRGEHAPAVAVKIAEEELRRLTPQNASRLPVLDLIFLGMGEDGHIASLFPNTSLETLNAPAPFLVVENSPKPPPTRISMGYQVIFAAKNVWILVSGAGKAAALHASLSPQGRTPLARVIETRPVKILCDIHAANL